MKIINCITNSFFRTIGRVLAYLAIGAIIAALLSKAKLPSIDSIANDIFFAKVNASSFASYNVGGMSWSNTYDGSYHTTTLQDSRYYVGQDSLNNNKRYYLKFSTPQTTLNTNSEYFYFNILFRNNRYNENEINCITQYTTTLNNDGGIYFPDVGSGLYEYDSTLYTGFKCSFKDYDNSNFGINLSYGSDSSFTQNPCFAVSQSGDNYVFKCPIVTRSIFGLVLRVNTEEPDTITFGISDTYSVEINNNSHSDITNAITNGNNQAHTDSQNTQNAINSLSNATIENQNQNTQQQIESQQVCNYIDKEDIVLENKALQSNGTINNANGLGITDYINIQSSTIETLTKYNSTASSVCFYNVNKSLVSCITFSNLVENQKINIPNNSKYFRATINVSQNKPTFNICTNGNQALANTLTDNNINDSEVASELEFDMPDTSLGPFSGFLALPLTWIQNLLASNQNCTTLSLPLPFLNQNLELPCMYSFWQKMGLLGTLVQAVWIAVVGVRIFNGLFLLVVEVRSPEGNADYLTKIRSWEL